MRLFSGLRVLVAAVSAFVPSLCPCSIGIGVWDLSSASCGMSRFTPEFLVRFWSMLFLTIYMVLGGLLIGNFVMEFINDVGAKVPACLLLSLLHFHKGQDIEIRKWIWQHYGASAALLTEAQSLWKQLAMPTQAPPTVQPIQCSRQVPARLIPSSITGKKQPDRMPHPHNLFCMLEKCS